jgi:hypothetical protein
VADDDLVVSDEDLLDEKTQDALTLANIGFLDAKVRKAT